MISVEQNSKSTEQSATTNPREFVVMERAGLENSFRRAIWDAAEASEGQEITMPRAKGAGFSSLELADHGVLIRIYSAEAKLVRTYRVSYDKILTQDEISKEKALEEIGDIFCDFAPATNGSEKVTDGPPKVK